jgi:hypothetical protein
MIPFNPPMPSNTGTTSLGRRTGWLAALTATALIFAAFGAHSLDPRKLYHEMYPLEPVKQDAFHICDASDPTFVRAIGAEREDCYNKMPHAMAVAMGRAKVQTVSSDALTALFDKTALLMLLATTPPQQPITVPRSFADTAWVHALTPPCETKPTLPLPASVTSSGLKPSSTDGPRSALRLVLLSPGAVVPDGKAAKPDPLSAPDIGDKASPAIAPLSSVVTCGGV